MPNFIFTRTLSLRVKFLSTVFAFLIFFEVSQENQVRENEKKIAPDSFHGLLNKYTPLNERTFHKFNRSVHVSVRLFSVFSQV